MGEYIRYHEAERLFKIYPSLQVILKSLQADLDNISDPDKDDDIYSECMGNRNNGGLPHSGAISDTTSNVALRYRNTNRAEKTSLMQDINNLATVIDKLNYAITGMRTVQRLVLETYYWSEQNTWKQVVEVLKNEGHFMSQSKAIKIRNRGIQYIVTVSKITIKQYQFVMGMVE